MRFLIVDQCSASKSRSDDVGVVDAVTIEQSPRGVIETQDTVGIPARDLYTGKQQRRISDAVRTLRSNGHDVQRWFISAGFGLVNEDQELPPYDATFSDMTTDAINNRSRDLGITDDLVERIDNTTPFDVIFIPLGADYYTALEMDRVYEAMSGETVAVVFNREADDDRTNVLSLPARTDQARENGSAVIGLKGTYLTRFAARLGEYAEPLDPATLKAVFLKEDWTQSEFADHH